MTLQNFTLGTFAQQGVAAGSFESIATVTVGSGGAATVEFASIPSTYTHLQIRIIARTGVSAVEDDMYLGVNTYSGDTYSYHQLMGDGSSTSAAGSGNNAAAYVMRTAGANATSNVFACNIIDLLDYTNTNKNKTFRALTGLDNNGSGSIRMRSSVLVSTVAISSIKIYPANSTFSQYSHFALYGIKAA